MSEKPKISKKRTTPIADPYPILKCLKVLVYIQVANTSVAWFGPPLVRTQMRSNSLSASMVIQTLAPAVDLRSPKELTGGPAEIAARIVDILKNEAKVI